MKNKIILLFLISIFLNEEILSQELEKFQVDLLIDSLELQNSFAGGLNAPQFSEVDLNNDGLMDLYVFDKAGNVQLTFINNGSTIGSAFEYAVEYLEYFPKLENWVLLRDYNGDGIMDIFSYSDQSDIDGVFVYTGKYINDKIAFDRFNHFEGTDNLISFENNGIYGNIAITKLDYPAVDDIDGDGDLDIVTFDLGGTTVNMFRNLSVEMGFGLDSLKFELTEECWGKFKEWGSEIILGTDPIICPSFTSPIVDVRHAGSTLLTIDLDNDEDKELILGDISSSKLTRLKNGGTNTSAFMIEVDSDFPSYNTPTDFPLFLSTFYLDLDNDGNKDLVMSPNDLNNSENKKNVWFYKNTNTNTFPEFELIQDDFLVNTMIDLGTSARPAFADVNADGLVDIVVGNSTFYVDGNLKNSRLYLLENIGTLENPKFELVDDDYLNLKQYNFPYSYFNYSPTFGDIDSDGDIDLIVGEETGKLIFFVNNASDGEPFDFGFPDLQYQVIDGGEGVIPQIIDVNRDGLNDLLIGRRNGRVAYLPNFGTIGVPDFEPDIFNLPNNPTFGNIDTRIDPGNSIGSCAPFMIDVDGQYMLYSGTENGRIELYDNIDGNLEGAFNLVDSIYGKIQEGKGTQLAITDLENDGNLEYLIGNTRGGLGFYKMAEPVNVINNIKSNMVNIKVLPNPTREFVYFEIENFTNKKTKLRIFNSVGKVMLEKELNYKKNGIDISNFSSGIYFCEFIIGEKRVVKKMMIQ